MRRDRLLVVALLLAAAPASAGPFMHMLRAKRAAEARAAAAAAEVPSLPPAAAEAASPAAAEPEPAAAAVAATPVPAIDPASSFAPVEAGRNAALQKVADAGGREILARHGLMLWRFAHVRAGIGAQYSLTVSFFDGSRPDGELREHVRAHEPAVRQELSAALGVGADDVIVHPRPESFCCGTGCTSCLRSKPGASEYWTGKPANLKPGL